MAIGYRDGRADGNTYSDISFDLREGRVTTLLGLNGTGKSTLIKTLCRMLEPAGGQLTLDGLPLAFYSIAELSSRIAVVLTDPLPDGGMTAFEVVAMGRYPYTGFFGTLRDEDKEIVGRALVAAGVASFRDKPVAFLSDGERQKVMIAKSMAQQTGIIILDEPTAFLDVRSKVELVMMLKRLAQEGRTILMSSHDIDLALRFSDDLWVMNGSRRGITTGTTEEIVHSGCLEELTGNL